MIDSRQHIDVFITAGGNSSRMGVSKGLIELAGKPMIMHTAEMLSTLGLSPFIIANSAEYKSLGFKTIPDSIPGKGPLGALLTAFEHTSKGLVLLLCCDSPFFPAEGIQRLFSSARKDTISVTNDCEGLDPLHALYPVSLHQNVKERVTKNLLRMTDLIYSHIYRPVNICDLQSAEPEAFINFNEPEDIIRWKHKKQKTA